MNSPTMKMLPPFTVGVVLRSLNNPENYGLDLHNIPVGWEKSRGKGVRVAVLDTGRPYHRDLEPNIESIRNCINKNSSVEDKVGHSTHVCGIIAANAGGRTDGFTGIAPEAKLLVGKVLDDDGAGSDQSLAWGVEWAVDNGADVINMSLGAPGRAVGLFKRLKEAIDKAASRGVVMVCAAGNLGRAPIDLPGCMDGTISVGAVNSARQRAWFSNKGRQIDFAAAGVDIVSTYLNNTYASLSGTSMSAPQVAGICALLIGAHKEDRNHATPLDSHMAMMEHLQRISVDFGEKGHDQLYGWGVPVFGHINPVQPEPTPEAIAAKPANGFRWWQGLLWLARLR